MMLSEAALYALFIVWQTAWLGEAIAAKWVSGGNPKARAGGHVHGHGPHFFSTMWQEFWKKYMMLTTMGNTARHPHHYWRPAQQVREAIGAQQKPLQPWHTQVDR